MTADAERPIETQIERWRAYAIAHGASGQQADIVENQLRDHSAKLEATGLDPEESFLIALKRVAPTDEISRAFALEYSEDMWAEGAHFATERGPARDAKKEFYVVLACALAAAIAIKVPSLLGLSFGGDHAGLYARNLSLFALPFLAVYFVWKGGLSRKGIAILAAAFIAAAVFANAYPFDPHGSTTVLTAIHLPIVLWLTAGVAYVAGDWRSDARRMEYVRFTGEWLVNYALIAMGGGVLIALTVGVFQAIRVDVGFLVEEWILPCGAMGAVVVAAWLARSRPKLVGGMAPMLARVFTPLFAAMLLALLAGVVATRGVIDIEREVLIFFDLLLVVVLALVMYAMSARDRKAAATLFDKIQLVLVVCALGVDVFALVNIAARLSEFGLSANRTAAIGLNIILLVNLAWSAFLQARFVRSGGGFEAVERWQMRYLPVYALWAAIVVVAFPPLFGFA